MGQAVISFYSVLAPATVVIVINRCPIMKSSTLRQHTIFSIGGASLKNMKICEKFPKRGWVGEQNKANPNFILEFLKPKEGGSQLFKTV